jgi:GNAT superfamily N-acetyltransferase
VADVAGELAVVPVPADSELLPAVVALGDAYKKTLGLMPRGVYPERAAGGTLIAAVDTTGDVVGYAMYEIARGRVRLVHLCVDKRARGRGVARLLVDEISRRHPELSGIKVSCRADYAASSVWPKLGFVLRNEVPGRGKDKQILQKWWLDHGLPDLFSIDADEETLTVAIDHMILIDLALKPARSGAAESKFLTADWIAERIQLVITPESMNEIGRLTNTADRSRHRAAATGYTQLRPAPADVVKAKKALLEHLPPDALSESDLNHLAYAAASKVTVFATRDAELIATAADAAETALNLKVLLPSDVAVLLDQLTDAEKYRPEALRGTGYSVQDTPAGAEDRLGHLLMQAGGERRTDWRTRLRQLAADPDVTCQQVTDPDGQVILAWATRRDQASRALGVPLIRCAATPMASTVLRLLLFELKDDAVDAGLVAVTVTDPHISQLVAGALSDDAFTHDGERWTAHVLDARSRQAAAAALPKEHPWRAELAANPSPTAIATLERALWPAKLLDSSLPSCVIPIQPRWAQDLFSLHATLFERPTLLGISREHVYYRTPRANPSTPARVLWYASGQGRQRVGAVVGCSQLTEAIVDNPVRLFRRFRHLGVYEQQHVQAAARNGRATALRFVDTERFAHPVSLERLRALAGDCPIGQLQSPTMISSDLFGAVYREGTGRNGR